MEHQLKHYMLYFAKHLTQDQCILHDEGGGDGYLLPSNTLSTDYPIEADRGRGGDGPRGLGLMPKYNI